MTGLTIEQFTGLLDSFDRNYEKAIDIARTERGCASKKSGGQKSKLSTPRRRLFFILTYLKCYPTYNVLAVLFDLDRGNRCD